MSGGARSVRMDERWRRRAVALAWCVVLLPAAAGGVMPADSRSLAKGVRILYPAERSEHVPGLLRVVLAAPASSATPRVALDGRPVALERMAFSETWTMPGRLKATATLVGDRSATALWVGTVRVTPGPHTLLVGGQKRLLRGAKGTTPTGWTRSHAHPPVAGEAAKPECAGCHESTGGALGEARTPQVCAPCHDEVSVQLVHRHVAPPLARCATCHDPHGASRPRLLVDEKARLCKGCHEGGHSKW